MLTTSWLSIENKHVEGNTSVQNNCLLVFESGIKHDWIRNKQTSKQNQQTNTNEMATSALLWQKEATLENDISRKWAECVCYVHWHQCNIIISWLKYLPAGWAFLLKAIEKSRLEVEHTKSNLKHWYLRFGWFVTCFLLSEYGRLDHPQLPTWTDGLLHEVSSWLHPSQGIALF